MFCRLKQKIIWFIHKHIHEFSEEYLARHDMFTNL